MIVELEKGGSNSYGSTSNANITLKERTLGFLWLTSAIVEVEIWPMNDVKGSLGHESWANLWWTVLFSSLSTYLPCQWIVWIDLFYVHTIYIKQVSQSK